jgi:hypothetical protein
VVKGVIWSLTILGPYHNKKVIVAWEVALIPVVRYLSTNPVLPGIQGD